MSYFTNIFELSNTLKLWILLILLCSLAIISVIFFVFNTIQNTNNQENTIEGLVNESPIKYSYVSYYSSGNLPISDDKVIMSPTDITNGFYFVRNSTNPVGNLKVQMPYGYYKVDDNTMAQIPSGYMLQKQGTDPNVDYTKIIVPKTNAAIYASANPADYDPNSPFFAKAKEMPASSNGDIPDDMYLIPSDHTKMAKLPPGMKPNVVSLDITDKGTKLTKHYGNTIGYVSESDYYKKVFTVNNDGFERRLTGSKENASPLPPGIYYDASFIVGYSGNDKLWGGNANPYANKVRFLPYGKIANTDANGYFLPGYKQNPDLISPTGTFKYDQTYNDIINNYDIEFHGNVKTLQDQNDMYNAEFGSMTVLDRNGNLITIPRSSVQGDITYFQPSSFKYGISTYVPKYEDSVYLSRSSRMPTMAEYRSAFKTTGFCEENKGFPDKLEEKCGALTAETCASTSCCVLLGGAKCVAGNQNGPTLKQNYGDVFVRNKDFYTHLGKCYGNCP